MTIIKTFLIELIGGGTKTMSRSRIIILSLLLIAYGIICKEYNYIFIGAIFFALRYNNFKVQKNG
jgi:hypothetical protein